MSAHLNSVNEEIESLEDKLDAAQAMLAFLDTAREESFPFELVDRLMNGESPVRVYREYRGMSQAELAGNSAVGVAEIHAWEAGGAEPGLQAAARVARVLDVGLEALVPWPQD